MDAGRKPWLTCSACAAVIASAADDHDGDIRFEVPAYIKKIAGVWRDATLPDDGNKPKTVSIREFPTVCAKGSCVDKIMSDPAWTKGAV
jgi:hypothetical protein